MYLLLSVTELGYSNSGAVIEGNKYYIYLHLKNVPYWLRTYYMGTSNTWLVDAYGSMNGGSSYNNAYSLAPVIRLS